MRLEADAQAGFQWMTLPIPPNPSTLDAIGQNRSAVIAIHPPSLSP
jgi:hypothetical protein